MTQRYHAHDTYRDFRNNSKPKSEPKPWRIRNAEKRAARRKTKIETVDAAIVGRHG